MDFPACFRSIQTHDENFEQAQAALIELKDSDPIQYITNLLEIVNSDSYDGDFRLNAIKNLTYPIRPKYDSRRDYFKIAKTDLPEEIIDGVVTTLIPFLEFPESVANPTADIIEYYGSVSKSDQASNIIAKFLEIIDTKEDLTPELLKMYIKIIKNTYKHMFISFDQKIVLIKKLLEEKGDMDEKFTKILLKLYSRSQIFLEEEAPCALEIAVHFAENFPKQSFNIINMIKGKIPEIAPDFSETLFSIISAGPKYEIFFRLIPFPEVQDYKFWVGEHESDYMQIAISIIEESYEDELPKSHKEFEFGVNMFIENNIFSKKQDSPFFQPLKEYVVEHMGETSTPGKYAAAVINGILKESYAIGDLYDVPQEDVISSLIGDENQRIHFEGLRLILNIISLKQLESIEEVLPVIIADYESEVQGVSRLAGEVISSICYNNQYPEIKNTIIEYLIQKHSEEEEIGKKQEIIDTLKDVVRCIPSEDAMELIGQFFPVIQGLLEEDISNPIISSYIGLLGSLIGAAKTQIAENVGELLEFSTQLYQNNREDDSMYIIKELYSIFGEESEEILQAAREAIGGKIDEINNREDLTALCALSSIVFKKFKEDEELERLYVDCVLRLIDLIDPDYQTMMSIFETFNIINDNHPEIIAERANEMFNFFSASSFCCKFHSNKDVPYTIPITILNNITEDIIPDRYTLKNFIRDAMDSLSFYVEIGGKSEDKQKASTGVLQLLEIADKYKFGGEIKVMNFLHDVVKKNLPEECIERFMELSPPEPEPIFEIIEASND